jgi:ABC-2 type transport system permease protein
MRATLAHRAITSRTRWIFGWSAGIVVFVAMTLGFYPAFRDESAQLNEMFTNLPESIKSLVGIGGGIDPFSPVGYLSSQIYATLLPLLLGMATLTLAASIAGDEERGLLETTFSLPVSRFRIMAERLVAVALISIALSAVAFASTAATATIVDLGVGLRAMAWASVTLGILVLAVGAIAVFFGSLTGRKSVALTCGSVAGIGGYLITSLADAGIPFFTNIEFLSVFSLFNVVDVLANERPRWSLLGLWAVAVAFSLGAMLVIERRDIRSA